MGYSRYAIPRKCGMTTQTILMLMALAALVVGFGAVASGLSPWLVFGVASVPTAVVLVLADREISRPCGSSAAGGAPGLFETAIILSVTLFAAAAVAAVADGIRLALERQYVSALSRGAGCTLLSALGVGLVFYSLLGAALHCD
jgi:hypothetical protein